MDIRSAYNSWAKIYDSNENKTRDLEARALREVLGTLNFHSVLELGCGTGKNTAWLAQHANVTALDFSEEMMEHAKKRTYRHAVNFHQADLTKDWNLPSQQFDLITTSLVLEHIENLDFIFEQAAKVLKKGRKFYIGELHPFKQYAGSKAKFEQEGKLTELKCFGHHISEFIESAKRSGFVLEDLREWFDEEGENEIPRVLTIIFSVR
jgi:ubiquinone/menaquinone biosynthesis C-methylase UbiE